MDRKHVTVYLLNIATFCETFLLPIDRCQHWWNTPARRVAYCHYNFNFEIQLPLSDFELESVKSSWESERENSFTVVWDHPLTSSVALGDSLPTITNHTGEANPSLASNTYADRFRSEIKNVEVLKGFRLICPPFCMFCTVQKYIFFTLRFLYLGLSIFL